MGDNPLTFWEINARDGKRLAGFYRAVFDWEMEYEDSNEFHTVRSAGGDGAGIDGGIFTGKGQLAPHRALYVMVESVEETTERAREAGAKVLLEPFDGPGGRRLAFFEDLEGHVMGIASARS